MRKTRWLNLLALFAAGIYARLTDLSSKKEQSMVRKLEYGVEYTTIYEPIPEGGDPNVLTIRVRAVRTSDAQAEIEQQYDARLTQLGDECREIYHSRLSEIGHSELNDIKDEIITIVEDILNKDLSRTVEVFYPFDKIGDTNKDMVQKLNGELTQALILKTS